MPEPEEVIIDAAHHAATAVARLWRRADSSGQALDETHLEFHRERLRWLLGAAFGRELPIRVAQSPARPTLLTRLFGGVPGHLRHRDALPATNGAAIFLPARLEAVGGLSPGRGFRALALHQAARAVRVSGTQDAVADGLAGLLHEVAEAAIAECTVARELPGLADDLALLRAAMLERRPPLRWLTPRERAVEAHYRDLLADPARHPADPRDWGVAIAAEVRRLEGRYRALPRDLWWGERLPRARVAEADAGPEEPDAAPPPRTGRMPRRPQAHAAEPGENEGPDGPWMIQTDDPLQHVEDGGGVKRPLDRDEGDPEGLGDSLSELPQACVVTSPDSAREVLVSDDAPERTSRLPTRSLATAAIQYPEWDYRRGDYRQPGATVRLHAAAPGDGGWADGVLARRRALFALVKRRFERLRPRRETLGRQPDGEEVDVDAYVEAFADARAGGVLEQRLYRSVRPARRELALSLLVDVSGSTDAWVSGTRRIIDVEKEALLLVCHALEAFGDPYAIQAFSGNGPEAVALWPVKDFEERHPAAVRRRIAGLGPERYTRAGAALRHATALLAQRREQQRLLLLLSDGKPNDVDEYEGRYGVEDMRRAVGEARLQGLHCFCLTVDRHAPAYLSHVFGPGGYAVLRDPAQLPSALVDVLRELLRR